MFIHVYHHFPTQISMGYPPFWDKPIYINIRALESYIMIGEFLSIKWGCLPRTQGKLTNRRDSSKLGRGNGVDHRRQRDPQILVILPAAICIFAYPNFDPSPNGSRTGTVLIKLTSKNVFFLCVLFQQNDGRKRHERGEYSAHQRHRNLKCSMGRDCAKTMIWRLQGENLGAFAMGFPLINLHGRPFHQISCFAWNYRNKLWKLGLRWATNTYSLLIFSSQDPW